MYKQQTTNNHNVHIVSLEDPQFLSNSTLKRCCWRLITIWNRTRFSEWRMISFKRNQMTDSLSTSIRVEINSPERRVLSRFRGSCRRVFLILLPALCVLFERERADVHFVTIRWEYSRLRYLCCPCIETPMKQLIIEISIQHTFSAPFQQRKRQLRSFPVPSEQACLTICVTFESFAVSTKRCYFDFSI